MELATLYKQIQQQFKEHGVDTPELDARILIEHYTGCDHADIITGTREVTAQQKDEIEQAVKRRIAGEPVYRILGEREFWGLSFKVTPDTLDPRPDTEILVERALNWITNSSIMDKEAIRILDLGTGTGCILIALVHELSRKYDRQVQGIGVDFSHNTAAIALENVKANGLDDHIRIIQSDWMAALKAESFDLIVSNPPYIPNPDIATLAKEVQNHDPILALSGGDDGLDCYKKIIIQLKKHLNGTNRAFLEIGMGQKNDIARLVDESNLCLCDSGADLAGIPRVVEICRGDK